MKLYFSAEERSYVGNFLKNLIVSMKPSRENRRMLARLSDKFVPEATYVWLKPGQRQQLAGILAHGIKALESSSAQLKDRRLLSKMGSFFKGKPEETHLAMVGEIFDSVLLKLNA